MTASGRDAGSVGEGEGADDIVDRYQIELWRAAPSPDVVVACVSADAAYWHSVWGEGSVPT